MEERGDTHTDTSDVIQLDRRPIPAHAPSVWPGMCPGGGMVVRLICEEGTILHEHSVPPNLTEHEVEASANGDRECALGWVRDHPEDVVFSYVYDGDDGHLLSMALVAESDVRAADKAQQAEVPDE